MQARTHSIYKSESGWRAKTVIDAPQLGAGKVAVIETRKLTGGMLSSTASVQTDLGGGCLSHVMLEDLSMTIRALNIKCTEKQVRDLHAIALDSLGGFWEKAMEKAKLPA